jgi:GntR family transcriptional regulator
VARISSKAIYLQVRDELIGRLSSGVWKPGSALPSELDLARELGVSSGTVRKALDDMEAMRLVTRRQGRGTFVNDHNSADLSDRYRRLCRDDARITDRVDVDSYDQGPATDLECSRLSLDNSCYVIRLRRVRSFCERVFAVERLTLPAGLFPKLHEDLARASSITTLASHYRLVLGKATERVSVSEPPQDVSSILTPASNSDMALLLDRIVTGIDGQPIEWRRAWCRLAGNEYYLSELN